MLTAHGDLSWTPLADRFSSGPLSRASFGKTSEVSVTNGTIKKVITERGFGFIASDAMKEYFFHRGELDSSLDFDRLVGGEPVAFEVEQSPKGLRAVRVHRR
jgi:CspA family cold shock protein